MENPKIAGRSPQMVDLESGENKAWCACGKASNQPWCDGSHKDTGMAPHVFKVEETKKAAICLCKHTKNPPYCDGSHSGV